MLADTLAPVRSQTAVEVDAEWIAARAGELIATISEHACDVAASPRACRSPARRAHTRFGARWRTGRHAHRQPHSRKRFRCRTPVSPTPSWVSLSRCGAATAPACTAATASRSTPARETLAAERRILAAVGRDDGRRATSGDVELALARFGGPRPHPQSRPGRAGLGDGHLRTPCRARAGACRNGQDHRDGRTRPRLAQLGRTRDRPGADRRRGDRARRRPGRASPTPSTSTCGSRRPVQALRRSASRSGSTKSAPTP